MKLIIQNNAVVGTTDDNDQNGYKLADVPLNFAGDLTVLVYDASTNTVSVNPTAALATAKENAKARINAEAASGITAMDWRIDRAKERASLGLAGETVNDVLLSREALRRASSRIGLAIDALTSISSCNTISLTVTPQDTALPTRLSRLEFMQRFTDAEMSAIITASRQSATLEAALMKWQTAEGIVLTDPNTIAGVNSLETAGILQAGRAAIILGA